jgi:hypothetical protein
MGSKYKRGSRLLLEPVYQLNPTTYHQLALEVLWRLIGGAVLASLPPPLPSTSLPLSPPLLLLKPLLTRRKPPATESSSVDEESASSSEETRKSSSQDALFSSSSSSSPPRRRWRSSPLVRDLSSSNQD